MKLNQLIALLSFIGLAILLFRRQGQTEMLWVMSVLMGILLFFSVTWRVMKARRMPMADEIRDRTITWWWMVAIFLLALSAHRIVSFAFLGFLCLASLREYYSLLPMRESLDARTLAFHDRLSILIVYLSIPLIIYVAYIKWYAFFIILIPVYVFLLIPIIFVLQNRTEGSLKSMGIIFLGMMFFVHNLGHCLFMINFGVIVLVFCFTLTEVRDLLSGSGSARASRSGRGSLRTGD